ncbi:hypothetical protein QBC37DRAFT_239711, partial [Rhypophila decipiens]
LDILDAGTLGHLCVAKCRDELQSLRSKINSNCNKQTDLIVYADIAYPASFILDHYIYQYDISCYKDRNTGQLCDLYLGGLRNQSKQPDQCSDCILGVLTVQLGSPVGYEKEAETQFSSLRSKCGTAAISTTTPTSKATSSTKTKGSVLPSATCSRSYTVVQNDTCSSIGLAQKASTYDIVTVNSLKIFCNDLPKPGSKICLPPVCTPYRILVGDSCTGIATKWSVTVDELISWNPIFSFNYANIDRWWDFFICV